MTKAVALDPDVFDALELSALVNDGIGGFCLYTGDVPCCIMGHAMFLDGLDLTQRESAIAVDGKTHPVCAELIRAFPALANSVEDEYLRFEIQAYTYSGQVTRIHGIEYLNDTCVTDDMRVSFERWCALMHVVRGSHKKSIR